VCADVPGYEADLGNDAAWEAVRKKLRRDFALLSDVFGIQIEYDGASETYTLHPPFLTAEERDMLVAAAALVRVDGIDDEQLAALGAAVDADGQRVVVRVHRHLLALRAALANRQAVCFQYHGTVRRFEAWAVGLWRDRWYTVGFDTGADAQRVYRLARIEEIDGQPAVEPTGERNSYVVPVDFQADDALVLDPNNWGHDAPLDAKIRVSKDWVPAFAREFNARIETNDGDSSVLTLTVRHYESFRDRLLGYGTQAKLLEPPELVEMVRVWVGAIA
jgi:predicted DNA-binding transcriptional regulator YafY